jgi:3-methyladenine DNA glycosylase AlkD
MTAKEAQTALRRLGNREKAQFLMRFFKTGPGEYAHGDQFLGVVVPDTRRVARRFSALPLSEVLCLLQSKYHEERLLALLILIAQYKRSEPRHQKTIFDLYVTHLQYINNWDLVDVSAPHIVGAYLETRDRKLLYKLVRSKRLWDRRVAIVSTFHFIRQNDFVDTFAIAELLLTDSEDLMHKATGWMLREVGKRDIAALEVFLEQHGPQMPRTMLRYAIERFPERKRKAYFQMGVPKGGVRKSPKTRKV